MSDRTDWDAWDFGDDPDEGSWDEPTAVREPWHDEPVAADDGGGGWGPAPGGGPPRGALLAALAVMLVLAVGIAAVVLRDDDGGSDDGDETSSEELDTDDEASSTSSSSSSSSSSSTTVVSGTEGSVPDVGGGSSTTRPRGSTSTTRAGSTTTSAPDGPPEPACASGSSGGVVPVSDGWQEDWQTMPRPNDPARVSICIDDRTPKVGQTVTVTLRGDDPDAVIVEQECGYLLEWEGSQGNLCRDFLVPSDGPRPTPPQEPGHVIVRFTHVYGSPGGRTIVGTVRSSRYEGYRSPYASDARADLSVIVHA
jgi:hypothetical protein